MRICTSIFCVALLAGCARTSATPPLTAAPFASRDAAPGRVPRYISLYSFAGLKAGGAPEAPLVAVGDTLYGTTSTYGRDFGTVFAISPFGKVSVLHAFRGIPDGATPQAGLTWFHGALYGTTSGGGTHNGGTVFSIALSGSEHVIHNFGKGQDGSSPLAGLVALDGVLYGTTNEGGSHRKGTVFGVTPAGVEEVLHSFAGSPDGGHPQSDLIVVGKALYGTTRSGGRNAAGGTVFKMSPFGQVKVLHSFKVQRGDGSNPTGALVSLNGGLYGTTLHGGAVGSGLGTVFAMSTSGEETVIHSFGEGTDGAFPQAGLVAFKSELYGTTLGGGLSPGRSEQCISSGAAREPLVYSKCGTIYKIGPFGGERVLYRFKGAPDGANPEAALSVAGDSLYGTAYWGGTASFYGTVFRITP